MISPTSLQAYPLFAGLSEHELGQLASYLSKRAFVKGAYLYHPGGPVDDGQVTLTIFLCKRYTHG